MTRLKQQNGYVLLQTMFVFAILVVIVTQVQYQQRIQIERTSHSLFLGQAQVYAESAEAIARVGLKLDRQSSENDHLFELWNSSEGLYPVDGGGTIELQLNDLQGRFNVNWLSPNSGYRDGALKGFKKLLLLIELNTDIADELFQWFDPDSGADYFYSDENPSYFPSYTEMADVSELLLLKSITYEDLEKLKPYVSALPSDSALNINTAPAEVIQSIAGFIDEAMAQQTLTDRGEVGFSAVTDFLNQEVFKENEQAGIYLAQLTVSSYWFELFSSVTLQEKTLTQRTVLYRDDEGEVMLSLRNRAETSASPIAGDPIKSETAEESESVEEII
jgi:general secretion pathway protein K